MTSPKFSTLTEKRRNTLQAKNVVSVTLDTGTEYDVIPGSYTEESDPTITGPGGQVTFAIKSRDRVRIVLTYTHHIIALQYSIPGSVEEVLR